MANLEFFPSVGKVIERTFELFPFQVDVPRDVLDEARTWCLSELGPDAIAMRNGSAQSKRRNFFVDCDAKWCSYGLTLRFRSQTHAVWAKLRFVG